VSIAVVDSSSQSAIGDHVPGIPRAPRQSDRTGWKVSERFRWIRQVEHHRPNTGRVPTPDLAQAIELDVSGIDVSGQSPGPGLQPQGVVSAQLAVERADIRLHESSCNAPLTPQLPRLSVLAGLSMEKAKPGNGQAVRALQKPTSAEGQVGSASGARV